MPIFQYNWEYIQTHEGIYYGDISWDGRGDGKDICIKSNGQGVCKLIYFGRDGGRCFYDGFLFAKKTNLYKIIKNGKNISVFHITPVLIIENQIISYKIEKEVFVSHTLIQIIHELKLKKYYNCSKKQLEDIFSEMDGEIIEVKED